MEEYLADLDLTPHSSVIYNVNVQKRNDMIANVQRLDQSFAEWQTALHSLWKYDEDACTDVIYNFCAAYIESGVASLRSVCEAILRDKELSFLIRYKAADALGNYFYMYELLTEYMNNPKEDINLTIYIDTAAAMINISEFTDDMIEPLLDWIFTTKSVSWPSKYKLYKLLCDSRVKSTGMLIKLGRTLLTNNTLTSYTVLCLQLIKFDDKLLKSIFTRTKQHRDIRIKADIYDHLLQYNSLKKDALEELKKLGEGLKTLDSSQNVHMINADVDKWLQEYLSTPNTKKPTEVIKDLEELYKETVSNANFDKIKYALQRIELDNSLYGKSHLRLGTILARVWVLIENHKDKVELQKRLCEELIEMSETCSTGHLYRLMNVFSGFGHASLTVDPAVELKSVINKRVENYLATLSSELRDVVMDAWMDQDEGVLQKYLYKQLSEIHDEVYVDYVGQGIMQQQDFSTSYRDIVNKLFVS